MGLATGPSGIAVIERGASGYALARMVALPYEVDGIALTHDGKVLTANCGGIPPLRNRLSSPADHRPLCVGYGGEVCSTRLGTIIEF